MIDSAQNALAAKRVGQYLIDAGVLKREQLDEALDRQKRMSKAGFHVLLGTILEEMDVIDRQSLEAIILRQRLDEGSVNLGPDADWGPYRPVVETPYGATNGQSTTYDTEALQPQLPDGDLHDDPFATPHAAAPADAETDIEPVGDDAAETTAQPTAPVATFQQFDEAAFATPGGSWGEAAPAAPEEEAVSPAASSTAAVSGSWSLESSPRPVQDWADPRAEADVLPPVFPSERAPSPEPSVPGASSIGTKTLDRATDEIAEPNAQEADVAPASEETPSAQTETFKALPSTVETTSSSEPRLEASIDDAMPPAPLSESQTGFSPSNADVDSTGPVEVMGFRFTRRAHGLSETEVSAVIGQLVRRTRTLEEQTNEAKETVTHLDSMRRYGEQTVKAADTIAQQIHHEAEQQAAVIRDRAQQEARKIVADARTEHHHIVRSAGEKAKQVAVDVAQSIEQHRELNQRMMNQAEQLIHGDADPADNGHA